MENRPRPLCLIILDGWGINPEKRGNAISEASTPHFDKWQSKYPYTLLGASGKEVGLPPGQMGNSEVGHLNIGAGRIVPQEFTRISQDIKEDGFFKNPVLLKAFRMAKKNNSSLHLMGLLSDGGVHSHNTHLYALLELARQEGINNLYLHLFLDGRDTPPRSAAVYTKELEEKIEEIGVGEIATLSGRYYAMDRDRRWERVKLAYEAMVYGKGGAATMALQAIEESYNKNNDDEFLKPTILEGAAKIKDGDSVVFFNFRPDRARQITRAFIEEDFKGFDRGPHPPRVFFVCMTEYDVTFKTPVAYSPLKLKNILADVLAKENLRQLRIAETEKYAHVTFFFNGGEEEKRKYEERKLIDSPKVATYDLKPEMSAYEVTKVVIREIIRGVHDVIVLNYANSDMVGHTGIFEAAVKAIEAIDECLGQVVGAVQDQRGEILITADHGNAEQMIDYDTGKRHTAHTSNPVPLIYISEKDASLREGGCLADIAPTILEILKVSKPLEMTGRSLVAKLEA